MQRQCRSSFPFFGNFSLRTAYVIAFGLGVRKHGIHVDNSDLSINTCLLNMDEKGGGKLLVDKPTTSSGPYLGSMSSHHDELEQTVNDSIIHSGRSPHRSTEIGASKFRFNLILWINVVFYFPLFSKLPKDCMSCVLKFLDPPELSSLSCTSRMMQNMVKSGQYYRSYILRNRPKYLPPTEEQMRKSARSLYRDLTSDSPRRSFNNELDAYYNDDFNQFKILSELVTRTDCIERIDMERVDEIIRLPKNDPSYSKKTRVNMNRTKFHHSKVQTTINCPIQ